MYEQRPPDVEGEYQPPASPPPTSPGRKGWRNAGGAAVGVGLLLAKFKGLFAILLSLKWVFFGAKFFLSFGSIFVSIWFYALLFGWKLGIVFVLLVLVHEMGHWVTFRSMGVPVSLPYFIPGFAAFVAPKSLPPTPAHGAVAALMGPVLGIAASGICYAYGVGTHNTFWFAAAYIGFFLNLLNLIPIVPFDGGRVADTIDPRLFWLGLVGFAVFIAVVAVRSPTAWFSVIFIGIFALPRLSAALKGYVPPQFLATPPRVRLGLALGYFGTIAAGALGAGVTMVSR